MPFPPRRRAPAAALLLPALSASALPAAFGRRPLAGSVGQPVSLSALAAPAAAPPAEQQGGALLLTLGRHLEAKHFSDSAILPRDWQAEFRQALYQSFVVVGAGELFDKTWFVALLCSLYHGMRAAFLGSFLALALHTVLAAALGAVVAKFFARWLLHFVAAAVFAVLAAFYGYDCYTAEPGADAVKGRTEDAKAELFGETDTRVCAQPSGPVEDPSSGWNSFIAVFMAVFVAEWGDRTQVSMMSLHSSLPVLPVCLGSLAAFFILSASAVLVARLLEGCRITERMISTVSAVSFAVFAVLAFLEGLDEWRARSA